VQRFAIVVLFATPVIAAGLPGAEDLFYWWLRSDAYPVLDAAVPIYPLPDPGVVDHIGRFVRGFQDHLGLGFLWSTILIAPVLLLSERTLGRGARAYIVGAAVVAVISALIVAGLRIDSAQDEWDARWFYFYVVTAGIVGFVGAAAASMALSANTSLERTRER
jgi:hypothetical protein